jgi:hypothetical protein
MRNERWLSQTLRKKCTTEGLRFWSFEFSGYFSTPDLYCVSKIQGSFWIELKFVKNIRQKIPFRCGQQKWIREHMLSGGKAIVFVWNDEENAAYLINDKIASACGEATIEHIITRNKILCIENINSASGWTKVQEALLLPAHI